MKQLLTQMTPVATQAIHGEIEPGLLPTFRTLLGLQLVGGVVGGGIASLVRAEWPPLPVLFTFCILVFLFFYLCWKPFQRALGQLFLPLALAVAILLPIGQRLFFIQYGPQLNQQPLTAEVLNGYGWRGMMILLIPMVFVAWQYGFRRLLLVSPIVALSDGLLLRWFVGDRPELVWSIVGTALGEGITFLVIGYVVTRMLEAQRQQRTQLAAANQQLSHYAATIEQLTTSRERNRLARELHDTLAHTLSALAVRLEAVDTAWEGSPDEARRMLGKALAQTRSGLTETRRALQALRASPLEDLGLPLAVRTLAESTAARIGAKLTVDLPDSVENLPADAEQGLYRIAQEALNNVTKHATARRLTVAMQQRADELIMTITDDGQGFDPAAVAGKGALGVRGMQERAGLMGATLEITSAPGRGATVRVRLKNGAAA
jgi:signal transduction histidine kinase